MIDYDNCNVVLLIGTPLFQTCRFMDYLPQSHRVGNPVVEVTLFVAAVVVVVGLFSSEYDEEENGIILEHKIIYNVVCRSGWKTTYWLMDK